MASEAWVKEFRIAYEEEHLNVIMWGVPTIDILDEFITTLTLLRNQWIKEQAIARADNSTSTEG